MDVVEEIARFFSTEGAADYLGESLTQSAHMLQAGDLARRAGAPLPLVAAALLHDIGHFKGAMSGQVLMEGVDNHHGETGARFLEPRFGAEVSEPVRLHVEAKRYLCRVEPSYAASLSAASLYTLSVQGGPMSAAEAEAFSAGPCCSDAVALRRWDDEAKDPEGTTPDFESFRALLAGLTSPARGRSARRSVGGSGPAAAS